MWAMREKANCRREVMTFDCLSGMAFGRTKRMDECDGFEKILKSESERGNERTSTATGSFCTTLARSM